ncbi:phosphate/phosphite/phosphonate ABC transporter substrate-binding protein [Rhodococcus wratislaviensis]|uniref:phosphate/phosphite/phosphonate ABC transporter substrate-binding protein n=1 Tax=Rhodococcus wratislaviensis TaxID=44752 RepID=UPI003510FB92
MRNTIFRAALVGGALASTVALTACGTGPATQRSAESPTKLVFAAIPSEGSEELQSSFAPLVNALEKDLGMPVEFQAANSNSGVIEAQVAHRVDIAVYGAFSYFLARNVAEVEPVAVPVQTPAADPGVHSYGLTRSDDTGINELGDAAGKDVCFTDPASTSGYLSPAAGLIEAGVDPAKDLTAIYAGGHDTAVSSLLAGDCALAFAADAFVDDILPARGLLSAGDVRKVWTSPSIPGPPVVVGTWLPEKLRQKIATTITSYTATSAAAAGFCEDGQVPGPSAWGEFAGQPSCKWGANNGFAYVPATQADFDPIVEICETTKAEVCTSGS